MQVVLSKKGFDTTYGGFASPILDDRLVSIPVPALSFEDNRTRYRELSYGKKKAIVYLLAEMRAQSKKWKGRIKIPGDKESTSPRNRKDRWELPENRAVHLDPDLYRGSCRREPFWRGLFGINGNYQGHIDKQTCGKGLEPGDLFLFFGLFERYRYVGKCNLVKESEKGYPEGRHVIFGYLQIGSILPLWKMRKCDRRIKKWMDYHSHIGKNRWMVGRKNDRFKKNTLYVAKETFDFGTGFPKALKKPGFGLFRFNDHSAKHLTLTKKGRKHFTQWWLPSAFTSPKKVDISHCHRGKDSCKPCGWETWESYGYFQLPSTFGQEFVIEESARIEKWAKLLVSSFADSQNACARANLARQSLNTNLA